MPPHQQKLTNVAKMTNYLMKVANLMKFHQVCSDEVKYEWQEITGLEAPQKVDNFGEKTNLVQVTNLTKFCQTFDKIIQVNTYALARAATESWRTWQKRWIWKKWQIWQNFANNTCLKGTHKVYCQKVTNLAKVTKVTKVTKFWRPFSQY